MKVNQSLVKIMMVVFGIGMLVAAGMTVRNIQLRKIEERGSMPAPTQFKMPSANIYG